MRSRRSWVIEFLEGRELLSGVSYSLTTDQSNYQLGQQVNMTFIETDTGDQPVTVEVGALNVDVAWGSGGTEWQADSGTPPNSETLQPGQSLTRAVTWDGGDTQPNGSHFYAYGPIQASIVDQPSGTSLASASFQIASPIQDTLTTDGSTFQLGQPIQFTFTRTNTSDLPVIFDMTQGSGVFQVMQGGQVVWSANSTLLNADSPPPDPAGWIPVLQPGQSWTYTDTWTGWTDEPLSYSAPAATATSVTGSLVVTDPLDSTGPSATFQIQPSPLSYSLTESGISVPFGQSNDLTYTITNTSNQPVTFALPPADFIVSWVANGTSGPATVWESDPGAASQPTASETLQPGQTLTETATWRGMANEGPMAGTDLFANTSASDFTVSVLGAPTIENFGFQTSLNPLWDTVQATGPGGATAWIPGQPINFTATETNTSNLPVTILNAGDAFDIGLGYDDYFLIPASDVSPVGQVVTLQPGQSQTFTATWDPGSDPNLPPGSQTYSVFFVDNSESFEEPYVLTIDIPAGSGGNPFATGTRAPTLPPTSGSAAASPLAATVSASQNATHPGGPVRITLTLQNASHDKVRLAPFSGRASITILRGSTVVVTARKRLSVAHARTLKPGRSLRLTTDLEIKPSRAEVRTLGPGTYTVEVEDEGYAAETAIRVGGF